MYQLTVDYGGSRADVVYSIYRSEDEGRILRSARRQFCAGVTEERPNRVLKQRPVVSEKTHVPFEGNVVTLSWDHPQEIWNSSSQRCTMGNIPDDNASVRRDGDKIIVRYDEFRRLPVELVFDNSNGHVKVRLISEDPANKMHMMSLDGDTAFKFLKDEVFRLTQSEGPVNLGVTGISFSFHGNHPIWGPHSQTGPHYDAEALFFASGGSFKNNLITAQGTDYDGYTLWNRTNSSR